MRQDLPKVGGLVIQLGLILISALVGGLDIADFGLFDSGQAFVYDAANQLIAIVRTPSPAVGDSFGDSVASPWTIYF